MKSKPFKSHGNFQSKKNIITGRNPVIEALQSDSKIDKIFLSKGATGESIQTIKTLAQENKIPIQFVPTEKLNSLTNILHQGVVAFKSSVEYQDLQQVVDWVNERGETALFLMLDNITDIRNIGAIARTAICCGVHALIIPEKGVGALNEEAVKSSAGALDKINICRESTLLKAIDILRLNGVQVLTSEMKSSKRIFEMDFTLPCCIIMGSEDKGVQQNLFEEADAHFTIPMKGNFDSLNVSVAAGMILYEVMRQRNF